MLKGFVRIAILAPWLAYPAFAGDKNEYDEKIMRKIAQRLQTISTAPRDALPAEFVAAPANKAFYVPLAYLLRGRARVAPEEIREEIESSLKSGELELADKGRAKLEFDGRRSSERLESAVEVARTRAGFVFIGQPEKVYRAVVLGSETIPVIITKDLYAKEQVDAWKELKTSGDVFLPESPEDLTENPPSLGAIRKKSEVPTPDEIIGRIERNLRDVQFTDRLAEPYSQPTIGSDFYLPIEYMMRGQGFISADNIYRKAEESFEERGFTVGKDRHEVKRLAWDDGKSSRNIKSAPMKTLVVKTIQGYIIIDGHHETYSAVLVGSKTIPVHVVDDFTRSNKARGGKDWSMADVWRELQRTQKTLFLEEDPEWLARTENRPTLRGMVDEPNRFLARVLAMKVITEEIGGRGLIGIAEAATRGVEFPVWMKVDLGVAMIEFHIARILTDAGIRYRSEWGETGVPSVIVEAARKALLVARRSAEKLSARDQILLKIPPIIESPEEAKRLLREGNRKQLAERIKGYARPQRGARVTCEMIF